MKIFNKPFRQFSIIFFKESFQNSPCNYLVILWRSVLGFISVFFMRSVQVFFSGFLQEFHPEILSWISLNIATGISSGVPVGNFANPSVIPTGFSQGYFYGFLSRDSPIRDIILKGILRLFPLRIPIGFPLGILLRDFIICFNFFSHDFVIYFYRASFRNVLQDLWRDSYKKSSKNSFRYLSRDSFRLSIIVFQRIPLGNSPGTVSVIILGVTPENCIRFPSGCIKEFFQ